MAGGGLRLKAPAGALSYPLGTPEDEQQIVATPVAANELPPLPRKSRWPADGNLVAKGGWLRGGGY